MKSVRKVSKDVLTLFYGLSMIFLWGVLCFIGSIFFYDLWIAFLVGAIGFSLVVIGLGITLVVDRLDTIHQKFDLFLSSRLERKD